MAFIDLFQEPMEKLKFLAIYLSLVISLPAVGQDFIMQGCYWSCPEDSPEVKPDSSTLQFWVDRMGRQAPELSHAGFSYFWLPSLKEDSPEAVKRLMANLQENGMHPIANLGVEDGGQSFGQQADGLQQAFNVNAYSLYSPQQLNAQHTAREINEMFVNGNLPNLVVAALPYPADPAQLGKWTAEVIYYLNPAARPDIDPRVYDYPLRETLRKACMDTTFDVRHLFSKSIRDASSISGFNVVTLANHPIFKNQNNTNGDWDDPIADPLLAYAYILINNQIGLPSVFYGDYYGEQSEMPEYLEKKPLKKEINQLIKTHKAYIYGSTSVEYLNRINTDKAAVYLSAPRGVDSTRVLIFQLDGTNTPAGLANSSSGKDVLAAINFGMDTLNLIQQVNPSNIQAGDHFTEVLESSASPHLEVFTDTLRQIPYAVHLKVPPRSYSAWVQGRAEKVNASSINLTISNFADYIELNWEIAYEAMALGYEVERSVNGKAFKRLASVAPIGKDDVQASYLYIDKDIFPGEQLSYRIKMLDREGGYEYSPDVNSHLQERALSFELVEEANPWVKSIHMRSNYQLKGNLELFDAQGELVFHRSENLKKGNNVSRIDLSRLPNGVYYLQFSGGEHKKWSKRLVKQ